MYLIIEKVLIISIAVDEGDLIDGEVHPIPHGAEESHREAQVHHVGLRLGHACMHTMIRLKSVVDGGEGLN